MRVRGNRLAFTLIEVMIVVVIMAVLAAVIIPQFSVSTDDARESTLRFNLQSLRHQLELYKTEHGWKPAVLSNGTLPQLTAATDDEGAIGPAGPTFKHGPYLLSLPLNPVQDSNSVVQAAAVPPTAEQGNAGWLYDPASGQIWANSQAILSP